MAKIKKVKKKGAKKSKSQVTRDIPTGVKIIAVFNYIGAGIGAILGFMLLFFSGTLSSLIAKEIPSLVGLGAGLFLFTGFFILGSAVLSFFIGRGLWNGKNWARVFEIVICTLGVVLGLSSMFEDLASFVNLMVNAIIAGYLLFNKEVKKVFLRR